MSLCHLSKDAELIALSSEVSPLTFPLTAGCCVVGRSTICQIVIQRKTVSRLHARVERDQAGRYILYDTNSANGTFVNKNRISERRLLRDDDEIGLGDGDPLLRFKEEGATAVNMEMRLIYDSQKMQFFLDKEPVVLTPGQFRLLSHLHLHLGEICTRESCAEALWGRAYDPVVDDLPLNRTISHIRRQFRRINPDIEMIVTHRSLGYLLKSKP